MAETVTNTAKNTATPTAQDKSASSLTWEEATFTWATASGSWDNPYKLENQTKNSASMTNQDPT